MNYTQNYQLPQWVESDRILMDDFNDSYQKLETALSGKADSADLTSLNQTVSALSGAVDDHTDALEEKGNCRVMRAYYVGTGTHGESLPLSLYFSPDKPHLVLVVNEDNTFFLRMVRDCTQAKRSSSYSTTTVEWSTYGVKWYADSAADQMNEVNVKYNVVVLMACD